MDSLLKALPAILKAAGASPEVSEAACFAAWRYAAGEGLRDHAVPLRLQEKTLLVAVADATWRKQMQSFSGQLLFRLNSILGETRVTFLDFREDPTAVARLRAPQRQEGQRQTDSNIVPLELLNAAASIQDNDLRRAFLGAATSCIRRLEKQSYGIQPDAN